MSEYTAIRITVAYRNKLKAKALESKRSMMKHMEYLIDKDEEKNSSSQS